MSAVESLAFPTLHIDYSDASAEALLAADDTLAVFGFGSAAPALDDPRYLRIALQPHGVPVFERWRASAPVTRGREDGIAWSEDGALQFGALELDEDEAGIEAVATRAYARLGAFIRARGYPHLLRMWNYLDGITHGDGDAERYRLFCVGRARGLGEFDPQALPAATAIGHASGARRLQVYWLAARIPGTPLENPRQVSAYRYPRRYGPQPPSFARAMLPPGQSMPLLISGTAAIVGHESRHAGDVAAQLEETLANLDSLIAAARARRPDLPAHMDATTRLKVYVRDREELDTVAAHLRARLDPAVRFTVLHAAVCRRELHVEIDGVHGAR
ncbi:pteridine-dependent deoxygenase [Lysobacter yangpyeongensis]|uniref:Pteridine-dependent deoxygenase n=1 Tax=Lysobacter yangpyeongensis TaxID=346182 RepID=A0ABW0SP30_9GAMM